MFRELRKFLVGNPLETHQLQHERLPKWKALAVFSSDALSSVAYATQEILLALVVVSASATSWSLPIALGIVCLLLVVTISYWQTIKAYPTGGSAYIVARENLGTYPGLITAAALLIDYILTAAVSVTAGVEAITSAAPFLYEYRMIIGCFAIFIVTVINLRGVRESGTIFAVPTYMFLGAFGTMLAVGFYKTAFGLVEVKAPIFHEIYPEVGAYLLMRAFASGCAALTGIEAISDGVPAFRKPEYRNAQITMVWMSLILGTFFIGATVLAHVLGIMPEHQQTLPSQIARAIFGNGIGYYAVQFATASILFLAANTAFADFPRVCSLLAQDRFLPRQLASLGDRLVFSKGIMLLGLFAAGLIIAFKGKTHSLVPLYAVGVFLSFTMSQSGMVRHHWAVRGKNWRVSMLINGLGALVTFAVLIDLAATKFIHGAWMVIVLIPILVAWFRATRDHYRKASMQLALVDEVDLKKPIRHVVVLPISGIHKGVIDAIKYSKSISKDVRAVYVELDPAATERLETAWAKLDTGIKLVVLPSPYRSIITPILDYIRSVDREEEDDMLTVVIPEFVTARWWEGIYHNQTAFLIRAALTFEKGKVVASVRYHLTR